MEIEFSLKEADLVALARHQIRHSPVVEERIRKRRWFYPIAFGMLALGIYLISQQWLFPTLLIAVSILSYIFFPQYFEWMVERRLERIVERGKTSSSLARRKLRVTAEGLEQIMENAESKVTWPLINAIDTTSTHTFVSIEGTYSVVIPKDNLESGSHDEFVARMREYQQMAPGVQKA